MGIETAALLAAAAISAGSAINSGVQANKLAHANADQVNADAEAATGQAQVEAGKIRDAAKKQQASARAALASSGVDVGTGTAEMIQTDITQRGEQDALTTILTGSNQARVMNRQADALRIGGRNAQTAGYLSAASSVLSSASTIGKASGWRSMGPGFSGTQAAAPVVNMDVAP